MASQYQAVPQNAVVIPQHNVQNSFNISTPHKQSIKGLITEWTTTVPLTIIPRMPLKPAPVTLTTSCACLMTVNPFTTNKSPTCYHKTPVNHNVMTYLSMLAVPFSTWKAIGKALTAHQNKLASCGNAQVTLVSVVLVYVLTRWHCVTGQSAADIARQLLCPATSAAYIPVM